MYKSLSLSFFFCLCLSLCGPLSLFPPLTMYIYFSINMCSYYMLCVILRTYLIWLVDYVICVSIKMKNTNFILEPIHNWQRSQFYTALYKFKE